MCIDIETGIMLTKIIKEEEIQKAKKQIDKHDKFVIVTHVSPDGDALGSSLGLYHFLVEYGKEDVVVIVPNTFPSFLQWMPGAKDILIYSENKEEAEKLLKEAEVIFCLDFNEPKRVDKMEESLRSAKAIKILIDHHLKPGGFTDLTISYPGMSSTSEMIFRFICRLGQYELINKEMAECIYTGMMTDTGSFTYNSNHPELYVIIGELIKKGIDKDYIYRKVYQVYSKDRFSLMGYVLYHKMNVYTEYKSSLITLKGEELNQFNYTPGDTEGFVNMPLSINGIVFSVFMREEEGFVKISLRSVGDFPCNRFAEMYFNGGGHKNASGGEFYGSLEEAVMIFEKGLKLFNPNNYEDSPNHVGI